MSVSVRTWKGSPDVVINSIPTCESESLSRGPRSSALTLNYKQIKIKIRSTTSTCTILYVCTEVQDNTQQNTLSQHFDITTYKAFQITLGQTNQLPQPSSKKKLRPFQASSLHFISCINWGEKVSRREKKKKVSRTLTAAMITVRHRNIMKICFLHA